MYKTLARVPWRSFGLGTSFLHDEADASSERPEPSYHGDHSRQPQRDHAQSEGGDREQRHGDPAEAVGEPEHELRAVQARHEPDDEERQVDRRVREGEDLQAPEGQDARQR